MGEFVVGTPALRLTSVVSQPLDLVSFLSLLYRAVPGSGLDPELVAARRALPPDVRADLDLLHGFSGRMLYYPEEPVMRFEPLRADRLDASLSSLLAFMEDVPAADYVAMAEHALARLHRDLKLPFDRPNEDDESAWRRVIEPGLTAASIDQVLPLLTDAPKLKERTIGLFTAIGTTLYREAMTEHEAVRRQAAAAAQTAIDRGLGLAFADLTGNRPPVPLVSRLAEIERVAFSPSVWLGQFVSYILYPPDLVVFFDATAYMARATGAAAPAAVTPAAPASGAALPRETLVDALRAVADPTRLQILDLLGQQELYAQEIVGRLGIAQSAVSRHLGHLQRAGLVSVRANRGMKYYAVDQGRLATVAESLRATAGPGGR